MDRTDVKRTVHWVSGTNVLAGVWLFIAPFALSYSGLEQAVWNDMVIGAAVFILAIARTASPFRFSGLSWTNAVLGAWLVIAPWVLGYGDTAAGITEGGSGGAATWNDIVLGIIILGLGAYSATVTEDKDTGGS